VGMPFKSRYLFQEFASFLFLFAFFLVFSVSWLFTSLQDPFCNKICDFFVFYIVHFIFFYFEQAVIAIVLAVLTVVLVNIQSTAQPAEPARNLSLKDYSPTEVLYTSSNESFNVYEDLFNIYENLVKYEGSTVEKKPGQPVNHALMEIAENNEDYHTQYIVAAEFNDSDPFHPNMSLNAMYSSAAFHSAPISLNLLTNAVRKHTNGNRSITVINHPLETKQVRW
jgi:hypothetical protein